MFKKFLPLFLLILSVSSLHAQTVAYVTNFDDSTVSVIDASTNTVTTTIPIGSNSGPTGVVVSPDGSRAFVTDLHGNLSVIDTASNAVVATVSQVLGGNGLGYPAITPDGNTLYVPGFFNPTVAVVSTATNTVTSTFNIPGAPFCAAVSPDGANLYLLGGNGVVSVVATASNTVVASITTNASTGIEFDFLSIAISPGGGNVYVADGFGKNVPVIATASNTVITNVPFSGTSRPNNLAVTPDGSRVYVADSTGNVVDVIDTATNTLEPVAIPVGQSPFGLAITPDGALVDVANFNDGTVSVIDTSTNSVLATVRVGNGPFGIAIANMSAPFAAFTIDNLVINSNLHEQGAFTLGANTGGVDLANQPLTLTVNNFSLTIPAGSFRQVGGNMHFVFNGTVNGLSVNFNLKAVNGSSTQFTYVVDVHGVSIGGPNPATVGLKIGHNSGTTTAEF